MSHPKSLTVIAFNENHLQLVQSNASGRGYMISSYSIVNTDNISDENISQALVKLVANKSSKLKPGTIIGVLPRSSLLLRYMMLPSHQEAELRNMVDLQISKQIPFPKDEVITDLTLIEKDTTGYAKVLVIVYLKEIIHKYLKICSSAGVAPQILTIGPLGVVEWYKTLVKKKCKNWKRPPRPDNEKKPGTDHVTA